ncbi:Aryldialkylphosphatase [Pseudomonas syringae pv. solidagae]|uniref:Aryldialkylphosphatase n=1 Tax=Pseudomonas syringae pv. solidagae TaxID=264458 RepID=A0A3M5KVP3_PSESX|nr:Aryldialkylphosphatase [Pseudomonas syringae pv. solidagae]
MLHLVLGKTVIDEHHHTTVTLAADNPPRSLHHLLHAGVKVGVVVTGTEQRRHALLELFVDRIELRQPQGGDERADQACARQVDTFTKRAAQHGKTDALTAQGEPVEKRVALTLAHPPCLQPEADVRVGARHQLGDLLQVIETAEERQVIARPSIELLGELHMNPLVSRDNCQLFDVDLACEELLKYRALGGETVVDPTNLGIGRDPQALQRISRLTGLNIIMGAGFYLEPSHPHYVHERSVEQLAEQIIHDVGGGEEKPEVIAGLIGEIGVSAAFTDDEEKSLRAAARASAATGVPLSVHLPGWERLGHRVLDIVEAEGADLRHTVLCHMNPSHSDPAYQHALAARGAFLEYDMIGMGYYFADEHAQSPSDEENARAIVALIERGFGSQVLLSQDVFLKTMLTRYGGHGYGYLLKHFVPRLRRHGVTGEQLENLLIDNPRRVFQRGFQAPFSSQRNATS